MTGGSRIVAFGPGGEQPLPASETIAAEGAPGREVDRDDEWSYGDNVAGPPDRFRSEWLPPAGAALAAAAWSGFYIWAVRNRLLAGVTPAEGAAMVADWAVPVLLLAVCWLVAMRSSRRESQRFGQVAQVLSAESGRLEERLTVVNRELSLAREFIAAQSRDLESLGRIAAERLSEHAERLQSLIRENGTQLDSIAGVSATALENMEKLRGHLPVVASSARDVANNIGHAGRVADAAVESLESGLDRVAAAMETSEVRSLAVTATVAGSLSTIEQRLDHIHQASASRLEELEHRGADLRARMEGDEAAALSALRQRLEALRGDSQALGAALRDNEETAMAGLIEAKERVEAAIREALERLEQLDRNALEAARKRIATLAEEAGQFDDRVAERNRVFAAEVERRLADMSVVHEREIARLHGLFARLDEGAAQRLSKQSTQQQQLATQGEAIAARLEELSDRIAAISAYGNQAEESLGRGLGVLNERLAASREALAGTDGAVIRLTDGAVRLLELLQASTDQSREQLPAALASGEDRLAEWEQRVADLRGAVDAAAATGDALAATTAGTRATLRESLGELATLQERIGQGSDSHAATLADLRGTLGQIDRESLALTERAQSELAGAIRILTDAASAAAKTLGKDTSSAVTAIAENLGTETAAAIDRVLRVRMAEAVGQLEQAAGHAAGVSREAAIQMRDQLARVDELAGNLERRVAQARDRAEEQLDNDFSRRVALITESLNSSAIDIAKALSTDVTDTAWAAYLRGDRGVFTRRAVRLLDAAEAREVARIYETDSEFREHVSRYIHDFEAMLRQLLSTRDGHALGVTLLSSDMGKLYVVLAQAIERLRG